jgi:hypothetical protein
MAFILMGCLTIITNNANGQGNGKWKTFVSLNLNFSIVYPSDLETNNFYLISKIHE